jgi:hypothetical protein
MASEQTSKMFQDYIYIFLGHFTIHTSVFVSLCVCVYTYILIYHSCCGIEGIGVVVKLYELTGLKALISILHDAESPSWYFCGLLHFPSNCSVRKGREKPHTHRAYVGSSVSSRIARNDLD